ncbi:hypothetical protein ElyMa_006580200 [Elysia marginata]|uniref:EGF-like domain-containing protein n=1 Tax=Elysia marginata TaxID=1093978 RepID=A0AAV4IGY4_9GAST|nr:hypothetical protein ElyMa_006580200 [Elysia marginata]
MTADTKIVANRILRLVFLVCLFRSSIQECPEGFFGKNCAMVCHCKGGSANCIDGNCTQGCDKEYIGPFCQYKAFPPREDKKMLWLQDSNPNTCNDGTVTPPVVIVPFFKTAVTYMRITFQLRGAQDSGLEFPIISV